MLLEREEPLASMSAALCLARGGRGHTFAIGGEAGIGKTALVEAFVREVPDTVQVLWGACESLTTPRPLGPFLDIADELGGALVEAVRAARPPTELFGTLLAMLRAKGDPTIVIVEDAHWIDDASADFVRFVARRVARSPVLLLVTWREEEVGPFHPLRRAFADIAFDHLTRVRLRGLSPTAVERLASECGREAADLHANTEGNPFLVAELLRSDARDLSPTLRDSLLERLARLSPAARQLAECVAVVPDRTERWMVDSIAGRDSEALQACIDLWLLVADRTHVRYRHELARRVVEQSLSDRQRRLLNARVLALLTARAHQTRTLPALMHHADAAGDASSVLRFALPAADDASRRGAHRQAAAFCRTALQYAHSMTPAEHATLLDRFAVEASGGADRGEALAANERAFELWLGLGDTLAQGRNRLARFELVFLGQNRPELKASGLAETAALLLEPHGPSRELALAHADLAYVAALRQRDDEFSDAQIRAIAMAEAIGDAATLGRVLLRVSFYSSAVYGHADLANIERAITLAVDLGDEQLAAQAYCDAAYVSVWVWRFDVARRALADGLTYTRQRDFDLQATSLLGCRARLETLCGEWLAAEQTATAVLGKAELPVIAEISAGSSLAAIFARRGDARATPLFNRVRRVAETKMDTPLSRANILTLAAQLIWHAGERDAPAPDVLEPLAAAAASRINPWTRGQAAHWLARLGALQIVPENLAPPFAMQLNGDWVGAAHAFDELGCPFDRAMALIDGDEAAQRDAFAILESLGATATITRCREMLAGRGARVPRGPRPSTRVNPMGLTERELEVLVLLERGMSNADIARALSRSEKTVEHHVAAVLAKLDARSRQQAAHIAHSKRLLPVSER